MIFFKALFLLQLFFIFINFRFSVAINFVDKTFPRNCFQEFSYELSFRETYLKYVYFLLCRTFDPFHGSQAGSKIVYLCLYFLLMFLILTTLTRDIQYESLLSMRLYNTMRIENVKLSVQSSNFIHNS